MLHPFTGRTIRYSSLRSQKSCSKTIYCYVCFELNRDQKEHKVLKGKYLYFGLIEYFLFHVNDASTCTQVFANIKAFVPTYDEETKMWFCSVETPIDENQC